MHSVVRAETYVRLVFDTSQIPRSSRLYGFLRVAKDVVGERDLYPALARELARKTAFVPRVILHSHVSGHSATSYWVVGTNSLESIKMQVRSPPWMQFFWV